MQPDNNIIDHLNQIVHLSLAVMERAKQTKDNHQQHLALEINNLATGLIESVRHKVADLESRLHQAEEKHRQAARDVRTGQARQLIRQARAVLESTPHLALLLTIEAFNITIQAGDNRLSGAEDTLREALANVPQQILPGHSDNLRAVAISPNKQWAVTAGDDRLVLLWALDESNCLKTSTPIVLQGHTQPVFSAMFSLDSRWLITGSEDTTVRLWDLSQPQAKTTITRSIILRGHKQPIESLIITHDNRWLITGGGSGIACMWDLQALDDAAPEQVIHPITLRGHRDIIGCMAVSPDNRWLATGSKDQAVCIFDLHEATDPNAIAAMPVTLRSHKRTVSQVVISNDGRWLVSGSSDRTIHVWNLREFAGDPLAARMMKPVILEGQRESIRALLISQNNQLLVIGDKYGTVTIWHLPSLDAGVADKPAARFAAHLRAIYAAQLSSDSRWLVTASQDGTARVWDLHAVLATETNAPGPEVKPIVLHNHSAGLRFAALSSDDGCLLVGGRQTTPCLWNLQRILEQARTTASPLALYGHRQPLAALATSPDGRWLATGDTDGAIYLWDLQAADPSHAPYKLPGSLPHPLHTLSISADNRWLVAGGTHPTIQVWDLQAVPNITSPVQLHHHSDQITALASSANSRWVIAGSENRAVYLWDLQAVAGADSGTTLTQAAKVLRDFEQGIGTIVTSLDSSWLVVGGVDGLIRLWPLSSVPDLPHVAEITLAAHQRAVTHLAVSQHWLASGDAAGTVYLWDLNQVALPDAAPLAAGQHEQAVGGLAFSPDGNWLASGGEDAGLKLWHLAPGEMIPATLKEADRAASSVAFSPDGNWLVSGGANQIAHVWNLGDLTAAPLVLRGHRGEVIAAAISADNRHAITGSTDGTAALWPLDLQTMLDVAADAAGRNFTHEEWERYFPEQPYRKTCEQWPLEGE